MTQLDYIPDSSGKSPDSWAPSEKKRTTLSNLTQENVAVLHTQTDMDKGDDRKDLMQTDVEMQPSSPWSVISNPSTTLATNPVAQNDLKFKEPPNPPLDDQPNSADMVNDRSSDIIKLSETSVDNNDFASSNAAQHNDAELHTETYPGKGSSDNGKTSMKATIEECSRNTCEVDPIGISPACFTVEQGNSLYSEATEQPSQPSPTDQPSDIGDGITSNIIIFGETGVGKSSVINLICGDKRAHVSDDALGCTFQFEKHVVLLAGMQCALWDTTGLDEGSRGTVPAEIAEANLKNLIDKLIRSGGIHLVIYCIRATRLTAALKRNYDLFYGTICQKKVPVALVVTGLEYEEERMEMWWERNEAILQRCGMKFDAHACVTTLEVDDPHVHARRLDSQSYLRSLVATYASQDPWKIEEMWSLGSLYDLARGKSLIRQRTIRRVIIYDSTAPSSREIRRIGHPQLEYEWICINALPQDVISAPPGALIFYASPSSSGDSISISDCAVLKRFYNAVGLKKCPVIVILQRRHDLKKVWDAILSHQKDIKLQCIAASNVEKELEATLELLYEDQVWSVSKLLRELWSRVSVYLSPMQPNASSLASVGWV